MDKLYYCRPWDESSGIPLTDDWGTSICYFETDRQMNVLRLIDVYANGKVLKYDLDYIDDLYGGLSEIALDAEEFAPFIIDSSTFEDIWQSFEYRRFPEIVCTTDTLWGQPRLDGTRLSVGDIVSLVEVNGANLWTVSKGFGFHQQQIRQALHYCKDLICQRDKPLKYCHNCSLRVKQDATESDKEDLEQDNWIHAARLFQIHFHPFT